MGLLWPLCALAALVCLRALQHVVQRLLSARVLRPVSVPAGLSLVAECGSPVKVGGRTSVVSVVPREPCGDERAVVLFVPGAGGQAAQFFANVAPFAPGGALYGRALAVLFSFPGHGANRDSYDRASLAPAALVDLVAEMYDHALSLLPAHARVDARVLVVCHSYGCALAARALPRMPYVRALLLLAPPVGRKHTLLSALVLRLPHALLDMLRVLDRLPRDGTTASAPSVRRMLGTPAARTYGALQLSWNANTSIGAIIALAQQACFTTPHEYGAMLRDSGVDATIVIGERDRLTPASGGFCIAGAAGSKCRFILVEGDIGHQVMFEDSAVVNNEIKALADGLLS